MNITFSDRVNDLIYRRRIYDNSVCDIKARGSGYILTWWCNTNQLTNGWEIGSFVNKGERFCLKPNQIFVIGRLQRIESVIYYIQPLGNKLTNKRYPKHSLELDNIDFNDIMNYQKITDADTFRKNRSLSLIEEYPIELKKLLRKKKSLKPKPKRKCSCKK